MKVLLSSLLACSAYLTAPVLASDDTSPTCAPGSRALQQLRIYEISRVNRSIFHDRFRDHAIRIMSRHGFDVIDIWESDDGEKLRFIYLLAWPDRTHMDASWQSFTQDKEWIAIKQATMPRTGGLVPSTQGLPLKRVDYSPVCGSSGKQSVGFR